MQRHVLARAITLLAFTVYGCGGYSAPTGTTTPPPPPPGTPNSVVVTNNLFTPASLTVAKSATVTWTWDTCSGGDIYGNGQTCVSHDIVFDDGAPGSGAQSSGTFSRTFAVVGTFRYHCSIHGAAMSGQIVVQ